MFNKMLLCPLCADVVEELDSHGTCGRQQCINIIEGSNNIVRLSFVLVLAIPVIALFIIYGINW